MAIVLIGEESSLPLCLYPRKKIRPSRHFNATSMEQSRLRSKQLSLEHWLVKPEDQRRAVRLQTGPTLLLLLFCFKMTPQTEVESLLALKMLTNTPHSAIAVKCFKRV